MKKCYIRFDDICPTMNWGQFEKAVSLMEKYTFKPLMGIVPCNQDSDLIINEPNKDYWKRIKQLEDKGWTIAMHGYTHVYDQETPKTLICGRKHSEFAGNPYIIQFEKIKEGKRILEEHGIVTNIFFAPAHTYDRNTLKALNANGFKYICDGLSRLPYKQDGIICIPSRSSHIHKKLLPGINACINHSNEWARSDKSGDYYLLESVCKKNKNKIVPFSDILNFKIGNFIIQKAHERLYIALDKIKSIIRMIVK